MKVLVTGAGALLGQGIIRALRSVGSVYEIVAVDPDERSVGLYWAHRSALVPLCSDPTYKAEVWKLLERERPVAVLIGTDVELPFWAAHADEVDVAFGTKVVVSAPRLIEMANDKWLTNQFLRDQGLPCPRSALVQDAVKLAAEIGFPLVVKPRVGARSQGVHVVHDIAALRSAIVADPGAVVQEHVGTPDEEFTSGVLCIGDQASVVTMRRDLRDGNTYRAYVSPDSPADPFLASLAISMGVYGPINFQFRLVDDVPYIFEMNARFSGTTPIRALAGFNEVHFALQAIVHGSDVPKPDVRPITVLRYWDELVLEPGTNPRL